MRVAYDRHGVRRQSSLGPRSAETEKMKENFERARDEASQRLLELKPVMERQAAVNRALGLGRVPLLGARIMRVLEDHGLMGTGIRVLGTHALYAYEAAAGVHFDASMTTTEDVDLLLDSRARLSFAASEDMPNASLLRILQRVDKSFVRSSQDFRAVNKHGYLVDLIKPLRDPPWTRDEARIGEDPDDLNAVEIAGLAWHESAPAFETTAIDEKGEPLRIVTSDPRIFAVHKFWLSRRTDRDPIKRRRDGEQAKAVAVLVARYFPHLPFEEQVLRMLPKALIADAKPLFVISSAES
ncbi:nucleotidyltransferase domain-containing protein [Rhodoblastus acidophilus]|uniref:Nucleotidyltransferase domain-containing protein n=1 Tax=Candidatus Rhodoblastus alkanivorans TaxID=2954117 RepID=A0ABS9Z212_9HYPH|nr:nucleotidyltransferase domain-containing protein [Candidatus Rhodoblastus alkanivorans]MCI4680935.1 nucleotidyltransferase domain-containing protein [Candidatus Rhodoblastus alkanivorans]MCI4681658.1 nucleotidyltransferase domain-containing protein [Candidatus Rhodoblastus alkanivorans]MDI4642705.1 nucleotidyltransferase domain-containing protein [Rhodoblastus acidophilus]